MSRQPSDRLRRLRRHRVKSSHYRPGAIPGSLDDAPQRTGGPVSPAQVTGIRYGKGEAPETLSEPWSLPVEPADGTDPGVTWIHVQGAPTAPQLQALERTFGLHPLALEDVLHQETRPKVEMFDAQWFVVLKRLWRDSSGGISSAQVSFFLGEHYLISVDEGSSDVFAPVRQRIHANGRICAQGADYLLYSLIDVVVDSGFVLLEAFGSTLDQLEDEVLGEFNPEVRHQIHYVRRELMQMRHVWWSQRDVVSALMHDESRVFSETTRLYLRDCHDHSVILIDFVEAYREMGSSLLEAYLSAMSQRMNDIMKALTVAATIFLPLTFLTGLYGMNFDTSSPWNLPELHWRYGYLYVLGLMIVVVGGMLWYFRRKRWW